MAQKGRRGLGQEQEEPQGIAAKVIPIVPARDASVSHAADGVPSLRLFIHSAIQHTQNSFTLSSGE